MLLSSTNRPLLRSPHGSGVLIPVLFFCSGLTALIGEVVWMRMLGLVLGNTIWAASAAISVWMGGMALGALIGGRLAPKIRRHVLLYGVAEGCIGLFYAFSPQIQSWMLVIGSHLGEDMQGHLVLGIMQRFFLATIALLIPTTLMGLTLPLLVERIRGSRLAGRISLLYGINTLGAACGVFFTAYWMLPKLGESGSLAATAMLCLIILLGGFFVEGRTPAPDQPEYLNRGIVQIRAYLVLAGLMGAASLAAELVWIRILVLYIGSRVYAFAVLLGVYLLGLALGSLLIRLLSHRIEKPIKVLAAVQLAAGALLIPQIFALGHTSDILSWLAIHIYFGFSFVGVQAAFLLTVTILFLPVTLLFGASFPLAVAADPVQRSPGASAGAVAAANTLGAILGSVGAPFFLIPVFGTQHTLLLIAGLNFFVALCLRARRPVQLTALAAGLCLGVAWFGVPGDWMLRQAATTRGTTTSILALEEDIGATVLVQELQDPRGKWRSLELNGTNVAGSSPSLLTVQQLQGQLPLLQVSQPRTILHIGFGSGGTCWAVSRHDVEKINVVEISPRVLSASDHFFSFINRGVLADPRVHTILNDGRNYLMATAQNFDAILSDSIHPVFAGNGALYTKEYFELCREHLNPGGVVSMWLPVYSLDVESYLRILSAFQAVFPKTAVWYDQSTVNEFTVVTGMAEPGPLTIDWEQLDNKSLAESLSIGGIHSAVDLEADLLLGPQEVQALVTDIPPHSDDLPWVEYMAGRTLDRTATWFYNLSLLYQHRSKASPFPDPPVPFDKAVAKRDAAIENTLRLVSERKVPGY